MKILYIHNTGLDSESANVIQVKAMCKAIAKLGHELVLSIPGTNNKIYNNYFLIDNYKIAERNSNSKTRISKYLAGREIRNQVKVFKPDLLYIRSPLLLKFLCNLGLPIIMELHNDKLNMHNFILAKYWEFILFNAIKIGNIVKIVCISQALTDYWIHKGIPEDLIITAHDGVDIELYNQIIEPKIAREKLGLPVDKQIVSYIGRLYEDRNIIYIIKLAKLLPDVLFIVVGGPIYEAQKYREFANKEKLKNITFIGQIPHIQTPEYLYAADILLALWSYEVPTINYCSPLKIFEYMAAGRTILAQGFPTILEVLHNNENAIIAKPDSFQDLYDKLKYALDFPVNNYIGLNARSEVIANYTWEMRVSNIMNSIVK